jgi:hypothetical protein
MIEMSHDLSRETIAARIRCADHLHDPAIVSEAECRVQFRAFIESTGFPGERFPNAGHGSRFNGPRLTLNPLKPFGVLST